MALTFSVNQTPSTAGVAMYTLISTLVAAGWTKVSDSDGSTYSSSGAQVQSGNSGANGFNNNYAWIVVKAPAIGANARSWCFQRGTSGSQYWRIKYSANAGFTGGAPSASQTPSATDEVIVLGAGTDASPQHTFYHPSDNSYRWHVLAGGAAENYCWAAWSMNSGTSSLNRFMFMDPLSVGSFSPSDPDPCVFGINYTSAIQEFINTTPSLNNPRATSGWMGPTNNINNCVPMQLATFGGITVTNSVGYGVNPFSNKDVAMPVFWLRPSSQNVPIGLKGLSSIFKASSTFRANMDVFNLVGTRDSVYIASLQLPWDGSVPIV